MSVQIIHNPRCSKSRQALALLEKHNIAAEIILYLEDAPSVSDLREILQKLNMKPRDIMRTGEKIYKELELADEGLDDDALLTVLSGHPILIERPIIIIDDKAVIGRPAEKILDIL